VLEGLGEGELANLDEQLGGDGDRDNAPQAVSTFQKAGKLVKSLKRALGLEQDMEPFSLKVL